MIGVSVARTDSGVDPTMDATTLLQDIRLLPVVVIRNAAQALPLAETLLAAGLRAMEITLRADAGLSAIEQVAGAIPDLIVGAGSVLNAAQLAQAKDAGARFAVSPGHTDELLDTAADFPYLPGAVTATEILRLLERGYRLQKFFPAESAGGVRVLQALSAPLPDVRFCVTGGLTAENAGAYLACSAVASVGGSWFVPADALDNGDYPEIERLSREAVAISTG